MPVPDATALPAQTRFVRLSVFGLIFGLLLSMLDAFIAGTALPTIVDDLGSASLLSWVVTAYALTRAVTTPVWGKLGDLYGRKRLFLLAIVVFVVGSVLVALAPSMLLLVVARAVQGVGAGGLGVGAFAVIGELVPQRERGSYQGLTAIVVAAGTIGGSLVGGLITEELGWRWAFLINLPLGALTLVWVGVLLKLPHVPRKARIDGLGAVLLSVSIAALILLTTWGGATITWLSAPAVALAVIALGAGFVFVRHERHSPEPWCRRRCSGRVASRLPH